MKKLFYIFCISAIFLSGCAKKEPATVIADAIKQDVSVMTAQVDAVKESLTAECKTPAIVKQLDAITKNIQTVSTKADAEVATCEVQKDVLKEENSKLKITIGFLLLIIVGMIILKIRKIL